VAKMKKRTSKKTAAKKVAKKNAPKKFAAKKPAPKNSKSKTRARSAALKNNKAVKTAKKPAHKPAPQLAAIRPKRAHGIPEQMRDAALKILDERQAEDVVCVDLLNRSSVADYMIVASGRAGRQIAAIAHYLREAFEQHGILRPRVEGLPEANWVLVDGGDVVVHLFMPEVRRYYNIEDIWNDRKKM